MSILSYPVRSKHGDASYRGNCAGQVYTHLFDESRCHSFLDATMGSGTGVEVALERGLKASGADLRSDPYMERVATRMRGLGAVVRTGFDSARDSLVDAFGQHDLVFAHFPYGSMLKYSDDPRCLSQMGDEEDCFAAMQAATLNMREATAVGGYYAVLLGDLRRKGVLTSFHAELLCRLPRKELRAVNIKMQHNTTSGRQQYGHIRFGPIDTEYLMVLERTPAGRYVTLAALHTQETMRSRSTWKTTVRSALQRLGGEASLSSLYAAVYENAPQQVQGNAHWQAKVRQVLQLARDTDFTSDARGFWRLAS